MKKSIEQTRQGSAMGAVILMALILALSAGVEISAPSKNAKDGNASSFLEEKNNDLYPQEKTAELGDPATKRPTQMGKQLQKEEL